MKYKTLFRLALKIVGVVVVVHAAFDIPWSALSLVGYATSTNSVQMSMINGLPDWAWTAAQFVTSLLKIALGIYLFFGGEWMVNKAIPSNKPYCYECGYLLRDLTGNRCPECDTPFKPENPPPPATS